MIGPNCKCPSENQTSGLEELQALARAVQAVKAEPSSSTARYEAAATALARALQRCSRGDRPLVSDDTVAPDDAAWAALDAGIGPFLRGEGSDAELLAGLLRAAMPLMEALGPPPTDPLSVFRKVDEIDEPAAARILSAYGQPGALLPEGEVAVLTGGGGTGKSAMLADIALALTTPPGSGHGRNAGEIIEAHGDPAPVLWLAFEEAVTAIRDRVQALDPDRARGRGRIRVVDMRSLTTPAERRLYGPADDYPYRIEPQAGMALLERAIGAVGEADPDRRTPRPVVVDTLLRGFLGDAIRPGDVLAYIDGLGLVARRYRLGILGIAHSTKAVRSGSERPEDLLDPGAVSGHGQWLDAPRTVMCLTGHHDDQAGRYHRLTITKTNVGPDAITIRIYRDDGGTDEPGPIRRFVADGQKWQSVYELSDATPAHDLTTNPPRGKAREEAVPKEPTKATGQAPTAPNGPANAGADTPDKVAA